MAEEIIPNNELNIDLPEAIAEGVYSNLAVITHSNAEFVVDFIRIMPNVPQARVKARVVLTPQHAKRLLKALIDNVGKYESSYGKIEDHGQMEGFPMHFGGPAGEA